MPTPDEIEEQFILEQEQITQGKEKLHKQIKDLEDKSYASASIYGSACIQSILLPIIDEINKTKHKIREGKTGKDFKYIYPYLDKISEESAALITCKIVFDKVFSLKDGENKTAKVVKAIACALEADSQLLHYKETVPGLLNWIQKKYWHESSGTYQKLKDVKVKMGHFDIDTWTPWSNTTHVKLGGYLLGCVMRSTQWFQESTKRYGRKTYSVVEPTPEFLEKKDELIYMAELFSPLLYPMLIPPKPWGYHTEFDGENITRHVKHGGYYTNDLMRGHEMVRRGDPTLIQGDKIPEFLNKIQGVGYRVNHFSYNVAKELEQSRQAVGKFIPIVECPIPPKPVDIADNEASKKEWKVRAKEAHNANAQAFKKSVRTRQTLTAAEKFKDRERFFNPHSCDYRGRAYPIASYLTQQTDDFGKSLLLFADESVVNDDAKYWIKFQVATTYGNGLDKDTLEARQQWAEENTNLISRIAEDPVGTIPDWEVAEEPWCFLVACWEMYNCVIKETRKTTSLPIAIDATCSGLQILSLLCKDPKTAKLVNVTKSDKPQDAYKEVADAARPHCPKHLQPYIDRKVTKRSVMTICYSAKKFSNRRYIKEALKDKGIEVSKEDLTQTVNAVRDAMNSIVPGPMKVMGYIEKQVVIALKDGRKYLEWTTPSGFTVHQEIMAFDTKHPKRIVLQLMGECTLQLNKLTDNPNIPRHKSATMPNLIHSLDASLLHLAVQEWDKPIGLIHDSVLCRATDMPELWILIRKTCNKLFAENDYLKSFAEQIGAEDKPPIIGDLKPESVIESTYFFC